MEIAIALGIGFAGYALSGNDKIKARPDSGDDSGRPRRRSVVNPYDGGATMGSKVTDGKIPRKTMADIEKEYTQLASKRWRAAMDPAMTGVVGPERMISRNLPYIQSDRKQNTSDMVKQTRLETFTGANKMGQSKTGTYRNKREIKGGFFRPDESRGMVSSDGTIGNPAVDLAAAYDRMEVSGLKNNVSPTEKIRVGRGVGVGIDVPASDGFHPQFRVLPANVNGYKRTTLPGRTNHGFSKVAVRSKPMETTVSGAKRFVTLTDRPLQRGRATSTAAQIHPEYSRTIKGRPHQQWILSGSAPITTGAQNAQDTCGNEDMYRLRNDQTPSMPWLNLADASGRAPGAYVINEYDPARFDKLNREQGQAYAGMVTGSQAGPARTGEFIVPPTQRDMHGYQTIDRNIGNQAGTAVRPSDQPRRTMKEQALGPSQLLNAQGHAKTSMQNMVREKLDKEPKRVAYSYVAPAGRMNILVKGAQGRTELKQDANESYVTSHASLPTADYSKMGTVCSTYNKLPTRNERLETEFRFGQEFHAEYGNSDDLRGDFIGNGLLESTRTHERSDAI